MASIGSKNTKPEMLLGPMMHHAGLRYRKHAKDLPGKPDFIILPIKLAVFVDGDSWHGYRYAYWRDKIRGNMNRDRRNREALRRARWKVIRIWEHQLKDKP